MMLEWLLLNLRYVNSRLRGHGQVIYLDFPVNPQPRDSVGNAKISAMLKAKRADFAHTLQGFMAYADRLRAFGQPGVTPNYAMSNYLPNLDAISLYSLLRIHKPKRYIEVGSGYSTLFARAAITDGNLPTHITCIDPAPRAEITGAADVLFRQPFETMDLALLDDLTAGDILFIDGSHRAFTNSDVTVAFLDALPRLKPGVLVHFHDIFLPNDYPSAWNKRYYNEQYLLACYLLAGASWLDVVMPVHFVSQDADMMGILAPLQLQLGGGSFWIRVGG